MGHGVRSALITGMIRALVEEHAKSTEDPGELLTRVNHALTVILKQAETTMFATCFYVVADIKKAQLRFANAGHPCALHISEISGTASKLESKERAGPAMGMFPLATYTTSARTMGPGDLIMLFTDGLFEVEDPTGNVFSQEQLQNTVNQRTGLAPDVFFARCSTTSANFLSARPSTTTSASSACRCSEWSDVALRACEKIRDEADLVAR